MGEVIHLKALARRYDPAALARIMLGYRQRHAATLVDPVVQMRIRRAAERYQFYSRWLPEVIALAEPSVHGGDAA